MNDSLYKQILEKLSTGYAYHKVIYDNMNLPFDYEFIEVNSAYEMITGLQASKVVGRKVSEVLPNHASSEFDWIKFYGEIAGGSEIKDFQWYSAHLKRWYKVSAYSSDKHHVVMLFVDISNKKEQLSESNNYFEINLDLLQGLAKILSISEDFLKSDDNILDYQKIADDFLQMSEAKYAAFNLYEEDGKQFTTVAISAESTALKKASEILGFMIVGKKWPHDSDRAKRIQDGTITRFCSLTHLVGNVIPGTIIALLEKTFNIGETVLLKIEKNGIMIGDLTLFMNKGKPFTQDDIAKVYAKQLGLIITRIRAEEKLRQSEAALKEAQKMAQLGRWELIHSTHHLIWSDTIFEIFELDKEKFGASYQSFLDLIHPDDQDKVNQAFLESLENKLPYEIAHRLLMKDGRVKWVNESGQTTYDLQGKPIKTIGIIQDITESKQTEYLIQSRLDIMDFASENSTNAVLQRILDVTCEVSSSEIGFFHFVGDDQQTLTLKAWSTRTLEEFCNLKDLSGMAYSIDKAGVWVDCVRERRAIIHNDYFSLPHRQELPEGHPSVTRQMVVPVMRQGRIVSILGVGNKRHEYTDKDEQIVSYFADIAWVIVERKLAGEALKQSEDKFRSLVENSSDIIFTVNHEGVFTYVSPNCKSFLGHEVNEVIGQSLTSFVASEEDAKACLDFLKKVLNREPIPENIRYRVMHKNGSLRWHSSTGSIIEKDGKSSFLGVARDITERQQMEELLFVEKERFKTTLLSIGDAVISTDNQGHVLFLNKVAEQLTGWTQEEAFGKPSQDVFNIINEFTRQRCMNPVVEVLKTGNAIELADHSLLISKDGIERPIEDSAAPIKDENNRVNGVVLVFRDFTDRKERQAKVEYLSFHDQLTGLYNRRFFEEELKRLNTERNLPITLGIMDVNGLKLVNDAFGHMVGDEVLIRVAAVMKKECRADDIIARIGGDEFVVLLPKTDSKQANKIISRIHDRIAEEKLESIYLSSSYGYQTKKDTTEEMAAIFKKAEDKMYRQKLSESKSMRYKTIDIIINTLFEKNIREENHSKRVSQLCAEIGSAMELDSLDINELRTVGLMHDIGKISIDDKILSKPGSLNNAEWQEIKRHPEIGYRILSSLNEYAPLAEYVLAHHERWDGNGYPNRLKGEEIPLEARIIAVADAYDTMTSNKLYRMAFNEVEAIEEIRRNAGTQFDPYIAKTFIERVLGKK